MESNKLATLFRNVKNGHLAEWNRMSNSSAAIQDQESPHLRECDRRSHHAEQLEREVGEHAHEVVLEAVVLVGVHLRDWILHPVEKEGVHGSDVVGGLCLLHGKPEERPLIVSHQAQACTGAR